MTNATKQGFSPLLVIVAVGLLVAVGAVGFIMLKTQSSTSSLPSLNRPAATVSTTNKPSLTSDLENIKISSDDADKFKDVDKDIKQL